MDVGKTERGFKRAVFADRNGVECSIQESSIATEHAIWLGCNDADPKMFIPYGAPAWQPLTLPELPEGGHILFTTRMHLTQEQVLELLPLLQHFAETGELPGTGE
jgi:hypothetical protein